MHSDPSRSTQSGAPRARAERREGADVLRLHIGRVVFDGVPLAAGDERIARAALEARLTALLSATPLPARLRSSLFAPSLPVVDLEGTTAMAPDALGSRVAEALHRSFGR